MHIMYMYVTLKGRILNVARCLSANSPPTEGPLCNLGSHGARRGERVQKAGAIGGSAALSTREVAPRRYDDACRACRSHTGTVEGFEVCLRGRRRSRSQQSRMTAPSTAHATRC